MPLGIYIAAVLLLCSFAPLLTADGWCDSRCVDSEGEAAVINNDFPSARTEAVARAKWAAVEQAVGVEVKAQSVVQNMALVDEAVSKQVRGVVTSFKVLKEGRTKDSVNVKVNSCVEPARAMDALSSLALNNSVAVFIPARKPRVTRQTEVSSRTPGGRAEGYATESSDEFDETSVLSEKIIGRLVEQGFTVIDVAPTHAVDAMEIEKAVKNNNFLTVRSLIYKFLSNILLIGKLDYTISTRKGEDIGYGLSMPFNNVTVRLTYRIVSREPSGKAVILAADALEARGLAGSVEDAAAKGMQALSEKVAPAVVDKLSKHIKGIAKKINVKVSGVPDLGTNFEVKDTLQNLAWVTSVEEKGLGDFIVGYPENPVYLANSIGQKGTLRVENFTPSTITVQFGKP